MIIGLLALIIASYANLQPFDEISEMRALVNNVQVVDRNHTALSVSYQNRWNTYDHLPLHSIPLLLKRAFILSEDQHFYEHGGIDWSARGSALWNALKFQKSPRGARTISEQAVRIFHPRPRTLWSKWMESLEVLRLENALSKNEILEFYLNEVPYAANRRGVVQAARYYFDRDLTTLSAKEMLALAVLVRAPSRYDLYKDVAGIDGAILRLAKRLHTRSLIDEATLLQIERERFELKQPKDPVNASHFVSFVRAHPEKSSTAKIHTTLDAKLQQTVQRLLDGRVKSLEKKEVHNGGAIVIDHQSGEILAWVVAGAERDPKLLVVPSDQIDTVITPRQPGSALKPFLYALALDLGLTDATIIEDSPLGTMIGAGYHQFTNYSRSYYGNVTLRQALGNSLNIPALRTIRYTSVARFYDSLHALGFESLTQGTRFYDEGLALGNGEVTLLELVSAYATLANHGVYRAPRFLIGSSGGGVQRRVYSDEASSLIANILADPKARKLEFGEHSVLNLPVQSAVKTGTSNDYHDAWAVGFNYRYVVGIWMGNLDQKPMNAVTGSLGPGLTLRSIFAELNKDQETKPLYRSRRLEQQNSVSPNFDPPLEKGVGGFSKGEIPIALNEKERYKMTLPTDKLTVAIDPRVPTDLQKLPLRLNMLKAGDSAQWYVNEHLFAKTSARETLWPLSIGKHEVVAVITHKDKSTTKLGPVEIRVKL